MKKILVVLFQLALCYQWATAQFSREAADDLILTQTDSDFLACLVFRQDDRQTSLDISKAGLTTFVYDLKPKSGDAVYYRLRGLTTSFIEMNFDAEGEIIHAPPFYELIKIKPIYSSPTIEKAKAIETALPHFTRKRVRSISCYLICDIDNQNFYWEIQSKAGRKNATEQTVVINALTGEYIRTNEFKYARR